MTDAQQSYVDYESATSSDDSKQESGCTLTDEMLASLSGMGIDMATDNDTQRSWGVAFTIGFDW